MTLLPEGASKQQSSFERLSTQGSRGGPRKFRGRSRLPFGRPPERVVLYLPRKGGVPLRGSDKMSDGRSPQTRPRPSPSGGGRKDPRPTPPTGWQCGLWVEAQSGPDPNRRETEA